MDALGTATAVILLIILFLGAGVWIFSGLMLVGICGLLLINDMPLSQLGPIMKGTMWKSANSWELAAIPIFIWMGELIVRTDISQRMFRGLEPWVDLLPGRLMHINVVGCTLFAAVSGSSAATTATVGKITVSSLIERHYDRRLAIGSLAGAGSLGLMIPPSIVMIVYGVLADQSIARLFAAGILPGLLAAGLYFAYIAIRTTRDPRLIPPRSRRYSHGERLHALRDLVPIFVLIPVVLGAIYTGIATPSEAGALGVTTTLALALVTGQLGWSMIRDSLDAAVRTTCMIVTIMVAAAFMSSAMAYLHVPTSIAKLITLLDLGPYSLVALLMAFYLLLGMFLEGVSILVMSLPITLPLVIAQGWDPIWFGVFLVIAIELGQVTPPVGFNLFVMQGLTGQPITQIAIAAIPFFLLLLLSAVIVTIFPQIALLLPHLLYG